MSTIGFSGPPNKPAFRNQPTLKPRGRWYFPLVVSVALGFGAYNYYVDAKARRDLQILEEEKRMARNQQLMDAYGSKDSLEDVQQALNSYEVR